MNAPDEDPTRDEEQAGESGADDYGDAHPPQSEPSAASPGEDAVAVMPDDVSDDELATEVLDFAEPFESIGRADLEGFLRRAAGARVVVLGASTHGTSEFNRMRSRLTRELVAVNGFDFVALEADWGDAARIDRYARDGDVPESEWTAFARFPRWMWRNREVRELVESLRDFNSGIGERRDRVAFHGLDLYGMNASIGEIVAWLEEVDPEAAREARSRYGRLAPWREEPGGMPGAERAVLEAAEDAVIEELRDLLRRRLRLGSDSEGFMEAFQNARLVADAEGYYRLLYRGGSEAWNVREQHMMETLKLLLAHHGPDARGVVWAHNAHAGDASATSTGRDGRTSLGELCREELGERAYLVGMVTDRGRVTAASRWEGPAETVALPPAREDSWEHLLTRTELPRALLPIREGAPPAVRQRLADARPERSVGVVRESDRDGAGEYVQASLARQFDEVVWFEETGPVTPLDAGEMEGEPDTYPFGV